MVVHMKTVLKWFRRILGFGFLGLITLIMLLFRHDHYFPSEDVKLERNFNKRLEEKIVAGETKIPLHDLTDFEWDEVCYIKIYSVGGYGFDIDKYLGYEYQGRKPKRNVCDTDVSNSLLFLMSDNKTKLLTMKRCFPRIGKNREYLKESHTCFKADVSFNVFDYKYAEETRKHVAFVEER